MTPNSGPLATLPHCKTQEELDQKIIHHGKPCTDAEFVGMTGPQHAPLRSGMMVYEVERPRGRRGILVKPSTAYRKARAAGVSMILAAEPATV
jgi:hypothetical protein